MRKIFVRLILFFSLSLIFVLGSFAGYYYYSQFRPVIHCVEGYYFRNTSKPQFSLGDWVCINVQDMSPERALTVCRHEVGHEIFAEYCEQSDESFEICMEVITNETE